VLDVGSNTVHLLVVDAHRGAPPTPLTSEKTELRLHEQIDRSGRLTRQGTARLIEVVRRARAAAETAGCVELLAFATSALRDATNSAAVLARVQARTGIALQVLPGEDEAHYTFLAARRWYGWSAGRLLVLDIGGGSLELAAGGDEHPDVAVSMPLGAGRLTRGWFTTDPPRRKEITALGQHLTAVLDPLAERVRRAGVPTLAVGTSKTFRSLARLTDPTPAGTRPASTPLRARRVLTLSELRQLLAFISRMSSADLAEFNGVSPGRAHQLVAGALVAAAAMRALELRELEICPWALREGVIFRRLDTLDPAQQVISTGPAGLSRLLAAAAGGR
jgi:exopolyphosphatase/guanosine-5'-triphosphate,3'-diphosphate pyrophosphatase